MYSERVQALVRFLPNSGSLEQPTHTARLDNPVCGDEIELYLAIDAETVTAVRYRVRGCPAAMACAAALSLLVEGKTRAECLGLETEDLLDAVDGLPDHKRHAPELALQVLRSALRSGE